LRNKEAENEELENTEYPQPPYSSVPEDWTSFMNIVFDRTRLSNLEKKKGQRNHKGICLEIKRFSCTGASLTLGQRAGHYICQHIQNTILQACDG
jgi:hypothetical protein